MTKMDLMTSSGWPRTGRHESRCRLAVLVGLLLGLGHPVAAGQIFVSPVETRPSLTDLVAMRELLDQITREGMTSRTIPGAAVALVVNGQVVALKGYGRARLERNFPVDPVATRFRVGSVSKVFTATAVMQLVEQGRLDLNADVNRYLGTFEIPVAFGRPVTIANLLTHTGGFEDRLLGTAEASPARVRPLEQYLSTDMPARVRPPGDLISYSNHGYTLLGLIVERVSGERFDLYLQRHVFEPLAMSQSTFAPYAVSQPDLASGYELRGTSMRQTPEAYVNIGPAAALVSTASDMTRFMLAQLGDGSVDGGRILRPDTLALMQRQRFTNDPRLPGMTLGFFESQFFNTRNLFHEGGIRGYSSLICLVPEHRLGLFVVNNGYRQDFGFAVADGFLKRFFPVGPPPLSALSTGAVDRGRAAAGTYSHVKHAWTTVEGLSVRLRRPTIVTANDDGTVGLYGERYAEIAPYVYRRADGFERLAFRAGTDGRVTAMFLGQEAYDRLRWCDLPSVQQTLLAMFVAVFLSGVLRKPDATRLNLEEAESPLAPADHSARLARLSRLVSALHLVFVGGLFAAFAMVGPGDIWFGVPKPVVAVLTVPLVTLPFALALGVLAWQAWQQKWFATGRRAHLTVVALAGMGFYALLHSWRLLGYRF